MWDDVSVNLQAKKEKSSSIKPEELDGAFIGMPEKPAEKKP